MRLRNPCRPPATACLVLAATFVPALGIAAAPEEERGAGPVALTGHFAFYSDLRTNLNDALIEAGEDRREDRDELFAAGPAADCVAALPAAERAGWERAVDFYADVVAPAGDVDPVKLVPRLLLAGIATEAELEDDGERRLGRVIGGMLDAAEPAYAACRWPEQDRANRRWIEELLPRLAVHAEHLAPRLAEVFGRPWQGLPLRVDVVETADWAGAHTINVLPPGAHVLISSSHPGFRGDAALEMVFHEAGHFLTGRDSPLRAALNRSTEELAYTFRGDLVHHVHFWLVGEVVRRALVRHGVDYEPFLYAAGAYEGGRFGSVAEEVLGSYLDGERTLEEAARDVVLALRGPSAGPR
ncbi:MAG TPA: hypothetical protein VM617_01430 [Thermoanaerobaculia bacterium]|nr:hypothetical protein [Thermoanaerobaculia bacterium]